VNLRTDKLAGVVASCYVLLENKKTCVCSCFIVHFTHLSCMFNLRNSREVDDTDYV